MDEPSFVSANVAVILTLILAFTLAILPSTQTHFP